MQEERRVAAWIGASVVVKGDVTSSEDMTIAGRVEGDVAVPANTLVIARQAKIQGDIVAREVVVHGQVSGSVKADRRLEVGETGSIDGDINAPSMEVAEGAVLHGRVGIAARAPRP
jgi:cytoskeletal protein CcmA (bactofilin family)